MRGVGGRRYFSWNATNDNQRSDSTRFFRKIPAEPNGRRPPRKVDYFFFLLEGNFGEGLIGRFLTRRTRRKRPPPAGDVQKRADVPNESSRGAGSSCNLT